jgi:heavy metal sensor kinase
MTGSLRFRLLAGMLGAVALLLLLFGSVVYTVISGALQRAFDASLETAAHTLAASVDGDEESVEVELAVDTLTGLEAGRAPLRFQFWLEDGATLMRSATLKQTELQRFYGDSGAAAFRSVLLDGKLPGRAVGIRFRPVLSELTEYGDEFVDDAEFIDSDEGEDISIDAPQIVLVVAGDTTQLRAQTRALLWLLFIAGALTMLLAGLVCAIIVSRGLRPLQSLAHQIEAIAEEDLAARIAAGSAPAEVIPIVAKLNDLLQRLEAAFRRQRAFTADAAHELRTPLAGMRTTIEVVLTQSRPAAEYREALSDCLEISQRMEATSESLLLLARLDAGQTAFRYETIELAALVEASWKPLEAKAQARGLTFDNQMTPGDTCHADKDSLATVLSNLLDNAIEYADENGHIRAILRTERDSVRITIENTGCKLSSDQIAHVFDRFWRADDARQDTGVHCGLGLALVNRIITSLGGSTSAEVRDGGLFSVHLVLNTSP